MLAFRVSPKETGTSTSTCIRQGKGPNADNRDDVSHRTKRGVYRLGGPLLSGGLTRSQAAAALTPHMTQLTRRIGA